ncbi:Phosphatidylglycerol/phosphatidylinositol transfer protein [Entophlyctis luteolus]|nr:Phosphatidylglycerol/phosphatidylinositol transfer protein [Entophlyctis luteolus]
MKVAFLLAANAAFAVPQLAQRERQILNGHVNGAVVLPVAVGPVDGFEGSISVCGDDNDTFHPAKLAMSPDPPQRGQPLDVTVIGELDRRVEDGAYIKVVAKLGLVKLFQGTYDVEARVFHADGQQMSCVHVKFKL